MSQRYQVGDSPMIAMEAPSATDGLPAVSVAGPGGFSLAAHAYCNRFATRPTYGVGFAIGAGSALGTYTVTFSYSIGGVPATQVASIEVVPGGDSGGSVISMFHHDRPEGGYVLAQLSSGRLVQGKNPSL